MFDYYFELQTIGVFDKILKVILNICLTITKTIASGKDIADSIVSSVEQGVGQVSECRTR